MKLYSGNESYRLYEGNMLDMLEVIEPSSIDAIVTDPPYELNFMNKGWDNSGIAFQKSTWEKCFKVLKPGGHMLVFGGRRTFHRIAVAIEDAGFEIRDTIMWMYGSGFPKSMNIGLMVDKKNGVESKDTGIHSPNARPNCDKSNTLLEHGMVGKDFTIRIAQNEWKGWGTCLKPSYEPVLVCRKPCEGTIVDNVLKYDVGGINIDECRIPFESTPNPATNPLYRQQNGYKHDRSRSTSENSVCSFSTSKSDTPISSLGRFPANTILTYDESDYDEVCGGFPDSVGCKPHNIYSNVERYDGWGTITQKNGELVGYDDCGGSAARYFYCAKASKRDRDEGLDDLPDKAMYVADNEHGNLGAFYIKKAGGEMGNEQLRKNTHPTVKPTDLMQYLVRLIAPKGATILDPFNGSGSTGKAVMYENIDRNADYKYIGIEMTDEYLPIAKARIEFVQKHGKKFNEAKGVRPIIKPEENVIATKNKLF